MVNIIETRAADGSIRQVNQKLTPAELAKQLGYTEDHIHRILHPDVSSATAKEVANPRWVKNKSYPLPDEVGDEPVISHSTEGA